jgi:hypothetical protein
LHFLDLNLWTSQHFYVKLFGGFSLDILYSCTACTSCSLRLNFSESLLVFPHEWWDYFIFFYIWFLISFLVFTIYSGCTALVEWFYFSGSLLVLPRGWREYFVFSTFGFYSVSCTTYIKWMYYSCRMVLLLFIKYLNFLAVFCRFGFSKFYRND